MARNTLSSRGGCSAAGAPCKSLPCVLKHESESGARKDYEFNWAAHCVKKASRGLHGRRGHAKLCHQCTALNRKDELDKGASCRVILNYPDVTVELLRPCRRLAWKCCCDHRVNNARFEADTLFNVSDDLRVGQHL
jgi:hypothetical protein